MWAQSSAHTLRKAFEPLSRFNVIIGAIALVAIMLLTTVDVVFRFSLNLPLLAAIELVRLLLVLLIFSGMAYAEFQNRHLRIDVLVDRFTPRTKLAVSANAELVVMVMLCITSWQCVNQGLTLVGRHTGLLHLPLWPFPMVIAFSLALFSLTVLIVFLDSLSGLVANGARNYLWMAPGVIVTLGLFLTGMGIDFIPFELEPPHFGFISLTILFLLIFLRMHIGAAMALTAFWGVSYLASPEAGLGLLGIVSESVATNYLWSVVPLFIWMGLLVFKAGYGRGLYNTAYKWFGHSPGGLASASIAACSGFSAVVGESMTGAITMGTVALPEMKAYKYDSKLATGAICAGASLGFLIPPSLGFVVYALMVEESIGKLFIAGIIPGILLTCAFIVLVYIRCRIRPALGPPGQATTFREKITSLRDSLVVIILFFLVVGGIYFGVFSPTEAGAIGAFVILFVGLVSRRLTFRVVVDTLGETVGMTAMIFFMFVYANGATQFFAMTNIPIAAAEFIRELAVSPYITIALILFMYLLLGCLMPALPVLILTLPVIFPTVVALGFDPIWFGVLVVMMAEIGVITPPIGITVFAVAGISDVPMYTIFRGVFPFWIVELAAVIVIVIFPEIALFLPNLLMGG